MDSYWPESYVEFICEEELLLPELLVFCPLVALGCRCTRWLEASLLFSLWLAPALLRTADDTTWEKRAELEEQTNVTLLRSLPHTFQTTCHFEKWKRAMDEAEVQMEDCFSQTVRRKTWFQFPTFFWSQFKALHINTAHFYYSKNHKVTRKDF